MNLPDFRLSAAHAAAADAAPGLLRRKPAGVLPHGDYHLAFDMFRMATMQQGILARSGQGSAAAADAQRTGRQVRPMAEAGWRLVQQRQAA